MLRVPVGAIVGLKGGFLGPILHTYPSEMAQNFWTAIYAWTTCFVATIVISLATRQRKSDEELRRLVYALTPGSRTATCRCLASRRRWAAECWP